MSCVVSARRMCLFLLLTGAGCGGNGVNLSPPRTAYQPPPQQQPLLATRTQELQSRANSLDRDNQELESILAQSRQQIQLLKDELYAVRDQLRGANQQLAQVSSEKNDLEQRSQALLSSTRRREGASIKANNSLLINLNLQHLQGVEVRQDGEVIRVEVPSDKLFHPGSPRLTVSGKQLVAGVVADILHNYPNQMLGVEGHTDNQPVRLQQFPSSHHLSTAQATAIYDQMHSVSAVPSEQLIVVGHGANHPVVSNATAAGKARNRRIELVIYPDTFRRR